MSNTVMRQVLDALKEEEIVPNQKELADALKLTKGHVSMLMKCADILPVGVRQKLHDTFKINTLWLMSNGAEGNMWADGKPVKKTSEVLSDRQENNDPLARLLKLYELEKADNARLTATVENLSKTVGELSTLLKAKS